MLSPEATSFRVLRRVFDVTLLVAGVWFVELSVMLAWATVVRKLGHPVAWSDEVAADVLLWGVFLAAGGTYMYGGHVNVDTVVDRLPPLARQLCMAFADVVVAFFALVFLRAAWQDLRQAIDSHQTSLVLVGFPQWPVTLGMVVGSALLLVAAVAMLPLRFGAQPTGRALGEVE
jgi:TRAP-type C4-dicarboxylate transport system permease small subunit